MADQYYSYQGGLVKVLKVCGRYALLRVCEDMWIFLRRGYPGIMLEEGRKIRKLWRQLRKIR